MHIKLILILFPPFCEFLCIVFVWARLNIKRHIRTDIRMSRSQFNLFNVCSHVSASRLSSLLSYWHQFGIHHNLQTGAIVSVAGNDDASLYKTSLYRVCMTPSNVGFIKPAFFLQTILKLYSIFFLSRLTFSSLGKTGYSTLINILCLFFFFFFERDWAKIFDF